MSIRNLIILVSIFVAFVACDSNKSNKVSEEKTGYTAIIDTSMTLMEIAKLNNIGDPFLRTKLGIPDKIGKNYSIATMAKRFNFTIEELVQIIEEQKNKQGSRTKPKTENNKKK
ncbi:MAG: hypothetical protein HQ521_04915 [Bacteroidetes bacterium]|nr:hypothetical protein [Bacteroidota bacterium]